MYKATLLMFLSKLPLSKISCADSAAFDSAWSASAFDTVRENAPSGLFSVRGAAPSARHKSLSRMKSAKHRMFTFQAEPLCAASNQLAKFQAREPAAQPI